MNKIPLPQLNGGVMAKSVYETIEIQAEIERFKLMIPSLLDKRLDDPELIDFKNKVLALKARSVSNSDLSENKIRPQHDKHLIIPRYTLN